MKIAVCLAALIVISAPLRAQSDSIPHPRVTVHLHDGSVVVGEIESQDSAHVTIHTEALGRIVIAREKIESIAEGHSRFTEPAPATAAELPPAVFDPPTSSKVEWRRTVRATVNYVSGTVSGYNGETKGAQLGVSVERKTDKLSIELELSAAYQKTDPNPESVNEANLGVVVKRELGGPLSLRAETLVEHNAIEELDYRLFQSIGLGWTPVNTKVVTLLLTPGIGYTAEQGEGPAMLGQSPREKFKNDNGFAMASFESLVLRLPPSFTITQDFFSFHALDDRPRLQYTANVILVGMITKHVGMTIGYKREFDTDIPTPINKTIERLSAGIQLSF